MNRAVLSGHEVIIARVIVREVNRETTGVDERHAAGLCLANGTSIHILLIGVCLTFELFQVCVLETFFHGPLNDAAISRDRDKSFSFVFALHPLDFPNDISVFVRDIFRGGEGEIVLGVPHIVY